MILLFSKNKQTTFPFILTVNKSGLLQFSYFLEEHCQWHVKPVNALYLLDLQRITGIAVYALYKFMITCLPSPCWVMCFPWVPVYSSVSQHFLLAYLPILTVENHLKCFSVACSVCFVARQRMPLIYLRDKCVLIEMCFEQVIFDESRVS